MNENVDMAKLKTAAQCKPNLDTATLGSICECCGKSLSTGVGALILFDIAIIGGKEHKVCRECGRIVEWACELQERDCS